jgi:arylsulfatase A-like enzyme
MSLGYLDGANDYWTSDTGGWCGSDSFTDLYGPGNSPAFGRNNSWACSQSNQAPGCVHEDDLFTSFALEAISGAAAAQAPLFLYFAPHAAHQPLEVPDAQLARFDFVCANDTSKQCQWRKQYAALVNLVDGHIGRIVDALKAAEMWDNTILFLSADNGGPIYGGAFTCKTCDGDAAANNFPLRGGSKYKKSKDATHPQTSLSPLNPL